MQVLINRFLRCTCKLEMILRTVYNVQQVYLICQDIALTLFTGFNIWLVYNCQTEEDHLNITIVKALLLYNVCTLLKMMEICVTNSNKLKKIHPREMTTFKQNEKNYLPP